MRYAENFLKCASASVDRLDVHSLDGQLTESEPFCQDYALPEGITMALAPEKNPASIYPQNLFAAEACPSEQPWWLARTKSRREKKLANTLAGAGIGYFLPLYKRRQPATKKERFSLIPLFPGYLFFVGGLQARYLALQSDLVAQLIEVYDRQRLLFELRQIHEALDRERQMYPHAFLKKGRRVRVISGPLEGLEGIISGRKGSHRLVLQVNFISQAVALDVAPEDVASV